MPHLIDTAIVGLWARLWDAVIESRVRRNEMPTQKPAPFATRSSARGS